MIPFLDLRLQYEEIKDEVQEAVASVMENSQFILGPQAVAFEEEFAAYCQADQCVAVNSGTSALHLALLAAGIGPGDEVITTPMTFVATVAAIIYAGATPVFVDVTPDSWTLDPAALEAVITKKTKAIIPVHLYGQVADMDSIMEIAKRHNILVIEDACQAHGADYKGRRAGSLGHMACFSFYPGKNLGAFGEGGALVTSDPAFTKKARMLRDWGQEEKYCHVMKGFNYRMDGIQAAVLRIKLKRLDAWTDSRIAAAQTYAELLTKAGLEPARQATHSTRHVYHVYAFLCENRSTVQAALNEQQIQNGIHYPYPVHMLDGYADLGYKEGDFPIAEHLAARELSLPIFPGMTKQQVSTVVAALIKVAE